MSDKQMSAHDHGNCELCDQLERELAEARAEIALVRSALNDATNRAIESMDEKSARQLLEKAMLLERAEKAEAENALLRKHAEAMHKASFLRPVDPSMAKAKRAYRAEFPGGEKP